MAKHFVIRVAKCDLDVACAAQDAIEFIAVEHCVAGAVRRQSYRGFLASDLDDVFLPPAKARPKLTANPYKQYAVAAQAPVIPTTRCRIWVEVVGITQMNPFPVLGWL